jgi:uncharacterized protein YegL
MSTETIGGGVTIVKRTITVFFLLDKSGSMAGDRIAKLNQAIPVTVEALKDVMNDNPNLKIVIKVIEFSGNAELTNGENGQEVGDFFWRDLIPMDYTATASAINILCEHLDLERMPRRGYPPVCVLVSDGYCTETPEAYNAAIEKLNKSPWGKKAARIVVSIGDDIDEEALRRFVNKNGSYINCINAADIVDYIKTKTTEATLSNSESAAPFGEAQGDFESQNDPADYAPADPDEVW